MRGIWGFGVVAEVQARSRPLLVASSRYDYLDGFHMRVKTSITLPRELLERLDRVDKNRSALLERAAEAYLRELGRRKRDERDKAIIEKNAERLNREAADVLDYQKIW
jgi:predicted DNA-binding protein